MQVDKSWIGRTGGQARIVIERGPVGVFARAVKSTDPVFTNADAARAAGFERIPAPPTFLMGAAFWGAFDELQPAGKEPPPMLAVAAEFNRVGTLLHGEQGFTFTRPVFVGDVLDAEQTIVDVYDKESKGATMTFCVAETAFRDAETGELVATGRATALVRH